MTVARFHPKGHARSLSDDYEVSSTVLGRGKHSTVVIAHHRATRRKCALKAFHTKNMPMEAIGLMASEVEVLLALDHPNIVRLHDVYETDNETVYMVMECCSGGELYDRLVDRGHLPEQEVADATRQMLRAVSYLHSQDVVHRDLKLENFLYTCEDRRTLKLVDFGFATIWDRKTQMYVSCGTRDYVSPEVLSHNGYGSKCDIWSLGVIVFMLLTGRAPIHAARQDLLQPKIKRGEVDWRVLSERSEISEDARNFLRALLVRDPEARLDARTATFHPWLIRTAAGGPAAIVVGADAARSLQHYAYAPRLRRAALQLIARQLTSTEAQDSIDVFLALAKGGCESSINLRHLMDALAREGRPEPPPAALRELLAVLDVNGDGQVYFSDFLAATAASQLERREEALRSVFCCLDADGSGSITAGDLQATLGNQFEGIEMEELIVEVDPDGQGEIDFEAFRAAVEGGGADPAGGAGAGGDEWRRPEPLSRPSLFPPPKSPTRRHRRSPQGRVLLDAEQPLATSTVVCS